MSHVRINLGKPGETTIEVDGIRVESIVRAVNVDGSVGQLPSVYLDILAEVIEVEGELNIRMPGKTREALIALGWAPPEQVRALIRGEASE